VRQAGLEPATRCLEGRGPGRSKLPGRGSNGIATVPEWPRDTPDDCPVGQAAGTIHDQPLRRSFREDRPSAALLVRTDFLVGWLPLDVVGNELWAITRRYRNRIRLALHDGCVHLRGRRRGRSMAANSGDAACSRSSRRRLQHGSPLGRERGDPDVGVRCGARRACLVMVGIVPAASVKPRHDPRSVAAVSVWSADRTGACSSSQVVRRRLPPCISRRYRQAPGRGP
jgi:hypothetical protein